MKKTITAISVAALLSAGSFAIAQDTGVGVDANGGVSVDTPAVDANVDTGTSAGASVSTGTSATEDNSYESLTSALAGSATVDLTGITEESQITIVLLSELEGEATAFDEAFAANSEGNATLQGNVSGNAVLTAKLEAEGYAAEDVVAIKSNADGSIVVYVDDRA